MSVGEAELKQALGQYSQEFDAGYGGFGTAPKFPPAVGISLLLRLHRRFGDPHALAMARGTLEAMARGGMYDHVGGGFARYSTDRRWLVPHFEKMLYDNALLVKAYLEAYQVTGDEFFHRVTTETLDYILREMVAPESGIFSSTDADSEGEEGKFFVWTPEQISEVLDEEEARHFNAYYDISPVGNWEGVSIPNTPRPLEAVAERLGVASEELERSLEAARKKVYAARQRRAKPGLDDKIITAWNGLMIGALAEGHRVLGEPRYLEAAERAAGFILEKLSREDGGLYRTYREGVAHLSAVLEDYAYLSEALIDLYEAGGSLAWLREAERLADRMMADFLDEETGSFFNTASDHEKLIMRYRDGADGATPFATTLRTVDLLLEGPVEIAFVGKKGAADLGALQRAVAEHYLPNRIAAVYDPPAAVAAELEAPPNGERPPTTIAIHLPGQATPEGTARYAAGIAETGSTELGTTGLRTGRLGFGAAGGQHSSRTDRQRRART
jgi:uncharacterized protein YyaL (SSP411 family)